MARPVALLLTIVTGFSGLVYEVTWQKYLATLLGSHSEATAAVLGIFLGGLALGYSVFGSVTRWLLVRAQRRARPPRLLVAYGLVEAGIGLYALLFPTVFGFVRSLSFQIPHAAGGAGFLLDVVLATLLIGPPTVLMGGTIPMLTQALARNLREATRYHAFVYAFNTVGAFAGAFAAGFFLIPGYGLVRVILSMGVINLVSALLFVIVGFRHTSTWNREEAPTPKTRVEGFGTYATVAWLSGFAMMALQTVLIRLAGLAFGSSEYTFAMVVSVFVLCIALGSFGVSALPRIRPGHLLGNQWLLVVLLALLYLKLPEAPYWAHVLRTLFRDTDPAFYLYYFVASLIVLVVLAPAVLLSGATLPLLFHHLRRQIGDVGIVAGRLYSWNTVGSLFGALLGGYLLLFWFDLHQVYRFAVGALLIGATMLTLLLVSTPRLLTGGLLVVVGLAGLIVLPPWDPGLLSAGLFRERQPLPYSYLGARDAVQQYRRGYSLLFYNDDPTTSAAVMERPSPEGGIARIIYVNGKPDSSTDEDYPTVGLAALIGALFAEKAERAFVVGYGTGVTVGELVSLDSIREVVVSEISSGVIRAAPLFDFANRDASQDSKLRFIRSDAYRALSRSEDRYDVIVSEPSNLWVTGVEMLYSQEFLRLAQEHLDAQGVYVQWVHEYEIDAATLVLMLRTFASVFDHVAVWYGVGPDLLVLGFRDDALVLDVQRLEQRARRPDFAAGLRRCGITSFGELLAHELWPLGVVHAALPEGRVHTLDWPRLAHQAGRAFFRGSGTPLPFTGSRRPGQVGASHSLLRRYGARFPDGLPDEIRSRVAIEACSQRGRLCSTLLAQWEKERSGSPALRKVQETIRTLHPSVDQLPDPGLLAQLAPLFPDSSTSDAVAPSSIPLGALQQLTRNFLTYYQHAAPFDGTRLLHLWSGCRADSLGVQQCAQGRLNTQFLLLGPEASSRGAGAPKRAR